MKYCKDCKWHLSEEQAPLPFACDVCTSPKRGFDLLDGQQRVTSCYSERYYGSVQHALINQELLIFCGPKAAFWEKK